MQTKVDHDEILRYKKDYNSRSFWSKITSSAKKIGVDGARKGIILWYVLKRPDVPVKTKALIIAALGYLIAPIDLVFDGIPFVGYTDDLTVLAYAYHEASYYVDGNMKRKANTIINKVF